MSPSLKAGLLVLALPILGMLAACSKSSELSGRQSPDPGHGHTHHAPHGGTIVVLGDEAAHLEFVREAATGTLTAYVLDGHMEEFIRISAPAILLTTKVDGRSETLSLAARADPLTGETVGDTSAFSGQADWLRSAVGFDAVLTSVTVRGQTFKDVIFTFPGAQADHGH